MKLKSILFAIFSVLATVQCSASGIGGELGSSRLAHACSLAQAPSSDTGIIEGAQTTATNVKKRSEKAGNAVANTAGNVVDAAKNVTNAGLPGATGIASAAMVGLAFTLALP
jgi:hypothetical protein